MGNIVINTVTVMCYGKYAQAGTNRNTLCNSDILNVLKIIKNILWRMMAMNPVLCVKFFISHQIQQLLHSKLITVK